MITSRFKVIFLGGAGVGKTSVIKRQVSGTFDFKMAPTIGSAHELTEIEIGENVVELCIWDTAGQEQFHSLVPLYIRNSHVAVIMTSITDHNSLSDIEHWIRLLHENNEYPRIVVAVNKIDLQGTREMMDEITSKLENRYGTVMFVSARTGDGIDELFYAIAMEALTSIESETNTKTTKNRRLSLNKKEAPDMENPTKAACC